MTDFETLRALLDEPIEFGEPVENTDGRYMSIPITSTYEGLDELIVMRMNGRTESRQLGIDGLGNGNIHTLHTLQGYGTLLVHEHQREADLHPNRGVQRLPIEAGGRQNVYPGTTYQLFADRPLVVRMICRDYDPELELIHPLKRR